ncbi:MAG TPA: cupin domain-containing protein [Thermoanaerobaculia bacterium]|nr:cupin domain-containing protein [Thermoanaerobaculia bacterium]
MNDQLTIEEISALDELIAQSIEPVAPPVSLREQIVGSVRNIPQNSTTVREEEGRWKPVVAGVDMKRLSRDARRGTVTLLLRFQPGSTLAAHDHKGNEQTYVIEGSCLIGSVGLSKGDFHHVEAGEHHGMVVSPQGCTLLLVVDEEDYRAA